LNNIKNERMDQLKHEIQGYYGTNHNFGIISIELEKENCIDIDYWYYDISTVKLIRIKQHISLLVKTRIGDNYATSFHRKYI